MEKKRSPLERRNLIAQQEFQCKICGSNYEFCVPRLEASFFFEEANVIRYFYRDKVEFCWYSLHLAMLSSLFFLS